jgi:3-hydroxymyristoyl/3-hydroxydecanoyl-(acyl carrier protein) dehydratase
LTALVYCAVHLPENFLTSSLRDKNPDVASLKQNVGYLVKVNTKFMSPVVPGDMLTLYIEIKKKIGILSMVNVMAKNGKHVIVEGEITVSEKK